MILFHTTDRIIEKPDLTIGRKNADFGQGFYLTPDESFAGSWARERTDSAVYVNRYELDPDGLNVKTLERDEEWFEFIFVNRRSGSAKLQSGQEEYDVIIGPIANDTLFETFGLITSGFLTSDQALKLLSIGPEFTQVVIKTARGAEHLRWNGAYTLTEEMIDSAKTNYAAESSKFETAFAKAVDAMVI